MSLPIEPPRLPEIQEIYLEVHKIFVLILISKISEMLDFCIIKRPRQKWRNLIPYLHFQIFSF